MDIEKLSADGITALRGFIPKKLTISVRDSILSELQRLNLKVKGKIVSSKIQDLPVLQQTVRLGQMVGSKSEVDRLLSVELIAAMSTLAGTELYPGHPHSQILLSFPHFKFFSIATALI